MPWSPETYDRLLAAIFQAMGEKISREFCGRVSDAMNGELSAEKIRGHLFKVKRQAGGQVTPSKAKPAPGKKGGNDAADGTPTKTRTPARKRAPTVSEDLSEDEEMPKKIKTESEDVSNFRSFFDRDEDEA